VRLVESVAGIAEWKLNKREYSCLLVYDAASSCTPQRRMVRWMVRWLVNGESEVVVSWSECALAFACRDRETTKPLRQDIPCPTPDSNRAPPEYDSKPLPLQKPNWYQPAVWYIFTDVSEEDAASIFRADEGSAFIRKVGNYLPDCMASNPRRLTNSMEKSPSWEAVSCAATQEIPSILWNPKVHYRVHKSPLPVFMLSRINPVHTTPSYLSKIHSNIIHPHTFWSS
jgi:hypothetical protein